MRRRADHRVHLRDVLRAATFGSLVFLLAVACSSSRSAGNSAASPARTTPTAATPAASSGVPLSTAAPPWPLPSDAAPYLAAAGLQVAAEEHVDVHYHAHLDIVVDGSPVAVPAGIGFVIRDGQPTGITALHTHDATGVIHIESQKEQTFTLGQFFTEWGVALSTDQLGGLRSGASHVLRVFVDGKAFDGNPADIVLRPHEEIALWYGPRDQNPSVPSRYQFPAGE